MTENTLATHEEIGAVALAADSNVFQKLLANYGLPTEGIVASTPDREIVCGNLPHFFAGLSNEQKRSARYLSKFVGAAAVGLFDAALNYIWNEVVENLRGKVVQYGVELFYDAALGGAMRQNFKDATDLDGLKDRVLLDTCYKVEIISFVLYKKLEYILVMRNEIAASHPTMDQVSGYELMSFVQVCVNEVIQSPLSVSAIQTKQLLDHLKDPGLVVDSTYVTSFNEQVDRLSIVHADNLLISFCGLYCDPNTDQAILHNIALLVPHLWSSSSDEVKYKIAARMDAYKANLSQAKAKRLEEFLDIVDGHSFRQMHAKEIELSALIEKLEDAHAGWDNYYHEPPVMQEVLKFCKSFSDVPEKVRSALVRIVLRCRIGRGISYAEGVSPRGKSMYDAFLLMLNDDGMIHLLFAMLSSNVKVSLSNKICQKHLKGIIEMQLAKVSTPRLKDALSYVLAHINRADSFSEDREFMNLIQPFART